MPPSTGSKRRQSPSDDSNLPRNLLGGAAVKSNLPPIPSKISTSYGSPIESAPIRRRRHDRFTLKDIVSDIIQDATQNKSLATPSKSDVPSQQQVSTVTPEDSRLGDDVIGDIDDGPGNADSEDEITVSVTSKKQQKQPEKAVPGQVRSPPKRPRDEEAEQHPDTPVPPTKRQRITPQSVPKLPHLRVQPERTPPMGPRQTVSRPATPGLLSPQTKLSADLTGTSSRLEKELNSLIRTAQVLPAHGSSDKAEPSARAPMNSEADSQLAPNPFSRMKVGEKASHPGPTPDTPTRLVSSPRQPPDTPTPGPSKSKPTRPQSHVGIHAGQTGDPQRKPGWRAQPSPSPLKSDEPSSTNEEDGGQSDGYKGVQRPQLPPRRRPADPSDNSRRSRSRSPVRSPIRSPVRSPIRPRAPVAEPSTSDTAAGPRQDVSLPTGTGSNGMISNSPLSGALVDRVPMPQSSEGYLWEESYRPPRTAFNQPFLPSSSLPASSPNGPAPTTSDPASPRGYHTTQGGSKIRHTPRPIRTAEGNPNPDKDSSEDDDSSEDKNHGDRPTSKPTARRSESQDSDDEIGGNRAASGNTASPPEQPGRRPDPNINPAMPRPRFDEAIPEPSQQGGFFPTRFFRTISQGAARTMGYQQPSGPRTPAAPAATDNSLKLRNRTVQRPVSVRQPPKSPLDKGIRHAEDAPQGGSDNDEDDGGGDPDDPDSPDGGGGGSFWFRRRIAKTARLLRSWLTTLWLSFVARFLTLRTYLLNLWERLLALYTAYSPDTNAGYALMALAILVTTIVVSNFTFWMLEQSSAHDELFPEDASSYNLFSQGRQWFGSLSDIAVVPSALARLVPLWVLRPGALLASSSTYYIESKLRDLDYELLDMRTVAKSHSSSIGRLEKILPELVHVPIQSDGKLKIQPAFFEALKDLMRKDRDILTLESDAKGALQISGPHYEAVKSRLASDPTGVGLSGVEVSRMIEDEVPLAWVNWAERNEEKVQKALRHDTVPSVVTREEFIQELQKELRQHEEQVMSDVRTFLDEDGQRQIKQLIEQALQGANEPQAHHSGREVVDVVREQTEAMLGREGLKSLADSKLSGLLETELVDRVNFFSPGSGAIIDVKHTSPVYKLPRSASKFLSDAYKKTWRPTGEQPFAALQSWDEFGECWCGSSTETRFGQSNGVSLSVTMGHTIEPEYVVVEHIPPSRSLDQEAAPKDMEVWAHIDDAKLRQRALDVSITQVNPEGVAIEKFVQIGSFRYSAESSRAGVFVYRIPQAVRDIGVVTDHIILKAVTNHGSPDHTCLYRVRMYGERADEE